MDLDFSADELAFRDEVRGWLRPTCPATCAPRSLRALTRDDLLRWHRISPRKGWIAPAWPKECGGTGWNVVQRYIFDEECGSPARRSSSPFGLAMVGPVLIQFGTDAQKQRFLPRIFRGEDSGARATRSRARAPTSRRCARAPSATATTTS